MDEVNDFAEENEECGDYEALHRKNYLIDLMCVHKITAVCADQKANYYPTCPTTFDDIAMINQLACILFVYK